MTINGAVKKFDTFLKVPGRLRTVTILVFLPHVPIHFIWIYSDAFINHSSGELDLSSFCVVYILSSQQHAEGVAVRSVPTCLVEWTNHCVSTEDRLRRKTPYIDSGETTHLSSIKR